MSRSLPFSPLSTEGTMSAKLRIGLTYHLPPTWVVTSPMLGSAVNRSVSAAFSSAVERDVGAVELP